MEKNIFSRIISNIKGIWDRLGEEDLPIEDRLDVESARELKMIKEVQEKIHRERSSGIVPEAKVDERKAAKSVVKGKSEVKNVEKTIGDE